MDSPNIEKQTSSIETARQTFTGKRLTQSQFDESWAVTGIIEQQYHSPKVEVQKQQLKNKPARNLTQAR